MDNYYILTWELLEEHLCSLSNKIIKSNFVPEVIITILWNGAMLSKYIAYLLNVNQLEAIYISYYEGIASLKDKEEVKIPTNLNIENKSVLLFDDIADSGKTLKTAINFLKNYKIKELKTATLYVKPHSKIIPDYKVLTTDKWIVFPWEFPEIIRKIYLETNKPINLIKKELYLKTPISEKCIKL